MIRRREVRELKPWVTVLGCVVFVANLLFLLWLTYAGALHAYGPDGEPISSYDAISLEVTILAVIVTAMAVGLGIAAIFGYQALVETVSTRLLSRADDLVNERLQNNPALKGPTASGPADSPSAPVGNPGEITEESAL